MQKLTTAAIAAIGVICVGNVAICSAPRVYFSPGTDCEDQIIKNINGANNIDVAVYSITNHNIRDALIRAHNRGANIRIIADYQQSKGKYSVTQELKKAGIPFVTNYEYRMIYKKGGESKPANENLLHRIMHNKFAIFDNKMVVSGSYNWTYTATRDNAENCIFMDDMSVPFSQQFEYLWDLYNKKD